MKTITVLLMRPTQGLYASTHRNSTGRRLMPAKKGSRVSIIILRRSGPMDDDCPVLRIKSSTSTGVRTTPRIFDKAALNSAAAVLPRATAVSTTEVEIVDGSTHR